jgi:hypothetical protein
MRQPDAGFLQLLPHDRSVHNNIGVIDLHFPRGLVTGRALPNAVFRLRLLRDGEDSFAQSIGCDCAQLSIFAGVIVFNSSAAASFTSSPTALSTRQVSQAECRLAPHMPVTGMLFPPRSSSNET